MAKNRAPKKPKASASVTTWKNYDEKFKKWKADESARQALIKKYRK